MTTLTLALALLGTLWLAWNNGSNDNFKGVATLYGCGVLGYRKALALATLAALAGSLLSLWLSQGLIQTFSGSGLIPTGTLDTAMLAAIGLGAGSAVLLATRLGLPVSTTHALIGALIGAVLMVDRDGIQWATLADKFAQPLLLSPLLAVGLILVLYPALRWLRPRLGVGETTCLCVGETARSVMPSAMAAATMTLQSPALSLSVGNLPDCSSRFGARFVGLKAPATVNALHALSAGSVCFVRAVNDTPKIAGLLLGTAVLDGGALPRWAIVPIALIMAAGGLFHSRKVAETLSRRITTLNHGQGVTANLVTSALVLGASHLGLPVSTTHVSAGAIFGIGAVNGKRNWRIISHILLAWASTLPLGLTFGAGLYRMFRVLGAP